MQFNYTPPQNAIPNTSKWMRIDGGNLEHGLWIWSVNEGAFTANIDLLTALMRDGWERVEFKNGDYQSLLLLSGQFAPTIRIHVPGATELQVWTSSTNTARIAAMPVLLGISLGAYGLADPIDAEGKPILQMDFAELLPHRTFGTIGLIKLPSDKSKEKGYYWYPLKALGQEGEELQAKISAAIDDLNPSGSWRPLDELDTRMYRDPKQWEIGRRQLKQALRLNATKPQERARREAQLEEFNQQYAEYIEWRERRQQRAAAPEEWAAKWEEIHAMVVDLAVMYWQHHQKQTEPQHATREKAPHVPDAVKHRDEEGMGMLFAPLSFPVQATLRATQTIKKWLGKPGTPDRYHNFPGTVDGDYVQTSLVAPKNTNLAPEQIAQQIAKILDRTGALEGDTIIANMAQALVSDTLPDGSYWIAPETFLAYRGVKPKIQRDGNKVRTAGYQPYHREAVIEAFERVMYLFVKVRHTHKGRKRPTETQSHLFLELERQIQPALVPGEKERLIAWRIKPGTWFDEYDLNMSKHFGWLMQQVLSYDPEHQAWEKYLGRYFAVHLQIGAQGGQKTIERKIRTLIDGCGIDVDKRNPQRTFDAFHRAMSNLEKDQVISTWSYKDTGTQEPPDRDPKRWLDPWLDKVMHITCSSRILEHGVQAMIDRVQERKMIEANAQAMLDEAVKNGQQVRKRGRPRKTPIPTSAKRQRGRPRKA